MSRNNSPFRVNTHELPRRAGEMREYTIDFELIDKIGLDLISVPAGDFIEVDLRLESVTEGVLATAQFFAVAKGQCIRCLDPVEVDIDRSLQELYRYETPAPKSSKRKRAQDEDEELEADDELILDGEFLDLEIPLRDAIVLDLPVNPLCAPDCQGLCPECGEKLETLPKDHAHELIDPRWAGLQGAIDTDFENPTK
ncbi:unannotated protein [freshwater metagenome]|uniref:Unannotated protein n=1 Tax=freshwater metagenome TaxID=449393 RepID=A0A6J7XP29_9ZZZZ|nr:DUF177 domain-containing protein [Actinomycetota bacterium]